MKKLVFLFSFIFLSSFVFAQTDAYGWEDGGTALGFYGNCIYENSTEQANTGTHSLKIIETPLGGTPQVYVWWVYGLTDGDIIDASFYVYDVTPASNPSGRIWGHYTSGPDVNSYAGSASGNLTYSSGIGWEQLTHQWTFDSDLGNRDGLVVEARIYSIAEFDNIYIDDEAITVTATGSPIIMNAGDTPLPVTLSSFTAAVILNEFVLISWTTESESNMSHFNLYRDDLFIYRQYATNTTETVVYEFADTEIEDGETYSYLLEAVELDGSSATYGPYILTVEFGEEGETPDLPEVTTLKCNYPNPFNPSTTISFDIKEGEVGILTIYNIKGQILESREFDAGIHNYEWFADEYDTGIYFYKLESSSHSEVKKMLILK